MKRILCWILGHRLRILQEIQPIGSGRVCAVECRWCHYHFIYSDEHEVFLRYDDDPDFQSDIREMYQLEILP